jgi:hypothetical protein
VELPVNGRNGYGLRDIEKNKCPGKALQTMLVRGMFALVSRRNRAAIRVMQAKLRERNFVKD